MVGILDRKRIVSVGIPRPSKDLVEAYLSLGDMAGVVSRALDQMGIMGTIPSAVLKPVKPGAVVVGPAITVRNIPEQRSVDALWRSSEPTRLGEREAFFLAEEGDVVVVDGHSCFPASCLGSMSTALASLLGVRGIVVGGAVTGVAGIARADIPVWTLGGTTITGHHRVQTVEINGSIGVCGVRVNPGDLIVGDDSGVTVVPSAIVAEVYETARMLAGLGGQMRQLIMDRAPRSSLREELLRQMTSMANSTRKA
jgi:regulator of RNase E activity RraA